MPDTLLLIVGTIASQSKLLIINDTLVYKLITVASNTDQGFKLTDYLKPSIELLIAIIGAIGLLWKYLAQKKKEFDEKVSEQKRGAYSEFLTNFTETAIQIMYDQEIKGIEADRQRMLARDKLLLFANDSVIKKYHEWVEYSDSKDSDIDKEVEIFGELLIEIRKDILGKSKVTKEEISNLNPFNRG
ncbi:MAG: hypothetical protein WC868_12035 [Bacteroidales bacterium]